MATGQRKSWSRRPQLFYVDTVYSFLPCIHMVAFPSIAELDAHLASRSYVEGYAASAADSSAFEKFGSAALGSKSAHKHAYRWALHIAAIHGLESAFKSAAAPSSAPAGKVAAAPAVKAAVVEEDDFNYGDEEEETEEDAAGKYPS